MSEPPLHYLSLSSLAQRIASRELSPVEVTRALLERAQRLEGELHSYALLLPQAALADAERAEAEIARGALRGPLHGVPIAVKDLCATKGLATASGTIVMRDSVPDRDAAVVARLREAGAVVLGKLQLTEGAFAEHHPDVVAPRNPWDPSRWTGVSSSGSAVATAAGLCYGSLGSDTGGSIRFPSACCGVVGLKPTWGRVPLSGVFPLATSLDHVGPMARRSEDCAHLLRVLAGHDAGDPASRREPVPDDAAEIAAGISSVRIGVDEGYVTGGVAPQVADGVFAALRVLEGLGARTVPVSLPPLDDLLRAWRPVTAVEAAIAHERTFPSRADAYGPALRELLEEGARVLAVDYARAEAQRRRFRGELAERFEQVDLIACPSFMLPAPPLELMAGAADAGADLSGVMRFTAPFDFSGSPTLSLPCGFDDAGLPLSLQLIARDLEESLLLRAGHAYEGATDWHERHPPLS